MIPLRDVNPSRTIPIVNYLFIGANIVVFLAEMGAGKHAEALIYEFGVVPARSLYRFEHLQFGLNSVLPFFTSMFMHGGWMHLIGNMLFLYIFGDNVEDRLGHMRYVVFYLFSGIAAACTQVFINPQSAAPMIGASGAIAGVLGAYVFMFPTARVLTLVPIFFFFQIIELPAFVFLGLWFLLQMVSGVMSLGIGADAGGIAWWAHIGGFGMGVILLPFLKKRN